MLGKLLKYEVKATGRIFLPLYGALLALAAVNRLFLGLQNADWAGRTGVPLWVSATAYLLLIAAIFALTFFVMLQRFCKNLLGDEGYLMFTLPVRPWQLILSKLAVSILWLLVSCAVTVLSILVMFISRNFWSIAWQVLQKLFQEVLPKAGAFNVCFYAVELLLCVLLGSGACILMIYAAISIGQLFNRRRALCSIGAYLLLFIALQTISALLMNLLHLPLFSGWLHTFLETASPALLAHSLFWAAIGSFLLEGCVFFLMSNHILSRHLNLE